MSLNLSHTALPTAQNPEQVYTRDQGAVQSQESPVPGEGVLSLTQPLIMGYHTSSFL